MISDFRVISRYDTGIAEKYEANGLTFKWTDWVLCEIAWQPGNTPHYCIASSFRNEKNTVHCSVWNPTYDEIHDFVRIHQLSHFRPISVILRGDQRPAGDDNAKTCGIETQQDS